jgi:hypothetical protein
MFPRWYLKRKTRKGEEEGEAKNRKEERKKT